MKYKINERFAAEVKAALDSMGIKFSVEEYEDYEEIDINANENNSLQVHRYSGELVLQNYKKNQQENSSITLPQYLELFNRKLVHVENPTISKLNNSLLSERIQHLKGKIRAKRQVMKKLSNQNKELTKKYQRMSEKEEEKLELTIQNLSLRTEMLKNSQSQDDTEELERIRSILRNGMWGCRDKIEENIRKISQIEEGLK